MNKDISFTVIALAGPTGAGKTSLARELCRLLDARFSSFGSFVRLEAQRRKVNVEDRVSLQNFGQSLIDEFGNDEFVKIVLDIGKENEPTTIVVDGVRGVEIWLSIQKLAHQSVLVYLDVDENTRIDRLSKRDLFDISSIRAGMSHPMEVKVPELRAYADIVLYDSPIAIMASKVLELFARPY